MWCIRGAMSALGAATVDAARVAFVVGVVSSLVQLQADVTVAQLSDSPDALRNWCLDTDYHKPRPGPEPELFGEVS